MPATPESESESHHIPVGYLFWVFGFTGAHRFYYGKPISGTIYFFTFGLFGLGWLVDAFLIPAMDREADRKFVAGKKDFTLAWALLTFFGYLGIHRFYLGKWVTGLLWLFTGGLFTFGWVYDLWTLNDQISEANLGM